MSGRSFKSVVWVATIGAAAVGCYMFSMQVAEERTGLAELDADITRTEAAIRTLRTELGTRGRVQQLEHWASSDFGYAAPRPAQLVDGETRLASLELTPAQTGEPPVRLAGAVVTGTAQPRVVQASAPAAPPATTRSAPRPQAVATPAPENPLLHRAGLTRPAARPAAAPARAATPAPRRSLLDPQTVRDLGERARAERTRSPSGGQPVGLR